MRKWPRAAATGEFKATTNQPHTRWRNLYTPKINQPTAEMAGCGPSRVSTAMLYMNKSDLAARGSNARRERVRSAKGEACLLGPWKSRDALCGMNWEDVSGRAQQNWSWRAGDARFNICIDNSARGGCDLFCLFCALIDPWKRTRALECGDKKNNWRDTTFECFTLNCFWRRADLSLVWRRGINNECFLILYMCDLFLWIDCIVMKTRKYVYTICWITIKCTALKWAVDVDKVCDSEKSILLLNNQSCGVAPAGCVCFDHLVVNLKRKTCTSFN